VWQQFMVFCNYYRKTPQYISDKINAGTIIRNIAPIVSGGGGGKPDQAQAGGKDVSKLDDALAAAEALLQSS